MNTLKTLLSMVTTVAVIALFGPTALAQTLNNGGVTTGSVAPLGDQDTFTFSAGVGDSFQLQMARTDGTSMDPEIQVFDPGGSPVLSDTDTLVAEINGVAATSGTYSVVVSDAGDNNTGDYALYFTRAPGANEGGTLPNGGLVAGMIELGDLDSYTFSASAGEAFQLQMATIDGSGMDPEMRLHDPTGQLVFSDTSTLVAEINGVAADTGTYTLVVSDSGATEAGAYDLYFVLLPGANEGGTLPSGGSVADTIDLGDLDSFTFPATAGEAFQLQMATVDGSGMDPEMRLFDPAGQLVFSDTGTLVAEINGVAAATGTYTVVTSDSGATEAGQYNLFFTRRPGANEGGALPSGGVVAGTIELGDLDSFTFDINANENFQLQMARANASGLDPEMRVFDPAGQLVFSNADTLVAEINGVAPVTGTYTLVVSDSGATETGAYNIYYVRLPGANEGGSLPNGGVLTETIELGDLDSYTFEINENESFQLQMARIDGSGLDPEVRIFDPIGQLAFSSADTLVAEINGVAAVTGTYTLVVSDSGATEIGDYAIYFAAAPGANEGGSLSNGSSLAGTIDRGDLDSFTFTAGAGERIQLAMIRADASGLDPEMRVYNPSGQLAFSDASTFDARINGIAPATGTYTLILSDSGATETGDYNLDFTRDGCVSFCASNPNATGFPALITCEGDPNLNLTLTASPVPNTVGQFFFGPMMLSGSASLGDGLRCVGGASTRILPLVTAGMMMQAPNAAALSLDYTAPYAAGLSGTQHFQFWFRSGLQTGTGSNTSDGVSITF